MTLKDKNMTGNEVDPLHHKNCTLLQNLPVTMLISLQLHDDPLSIMTQVKAIIKIEVSRLVAPLKTKGILKSVKLP
jgi:hypothetical protein